MLLPLVSINQRGILIPERVGEYLKKDGVEDLFVSSFRQTEPARFLGNPGNRFPLAHGLCFPNGDLHFFPSVAVGYLYWCHRRLPWRLLAF